MKLNKWMMLQILPPVQGPGSPTPAVVGHLGVEGGLLLLDYQPPVDAAFPREGNAGFV